MLLHILSRPGGKTVRLIRLLGWLGLRGVLLLLAWRFRMALPHLIRILGRAGSETNCLIQLRKKLSAGGGAQGRELVFNGLV